jgi:hypothetical protein
MTSDAGNRSGERGLRSRKVPSNVLAAVAILLVVALLTILGLLERKPGVSFKFTTIEGIGH